jgi:hypothetical protein
MYEHYAIQRIRFMIEYFYVLLMGGAVKHQSQPIIRSNVLGRNVRDSRLS